MKTITCRASGALFDVSDAELVLIHVPFIRERAQKQV